MALKKYKPSRAVFVYAIIFLAIGALSMTIQRGVIYVIPPIASIIEFVFLAATTMFIVSLWIRLTAKRVYNAFKDELDMSQRIMLTNVYKIFFYILGVAVVLYWLGVGAGDITLFLGLLTTGIAFAIRDIILSFFAWLIILNKKPFGHNDVITVLDGTNREGGRVDRIGIFYVTAEFNERLTRIPNKLFLDKMVHVSENGQIKGEIRLKIDKKPKKDWKIKLEPLLKKFEAKASLDSDGKDVYVVIHYSCEYKDEQAVRTKIIESV